MSEDTSKKWYAVRVATNYEAQAKSAIEALMVRENLQDHFGDILVPTEEVFEMRSGQKRKTRRKFFPGYVLVHMDMSDEIWHHIKALTKVIGFVGGAKGKPVALGDDEVQRILDRMQTDVDKPKPKVLYELGELVRVNDGPFADFDGVVEDVNYDKSRLVVSVLIFGRSTPVELEFSQVEKST
tara:strand:- start:3034 stop:3582 length:549 start_codon:yes stop_codon:yes gene_type:complete